MQLSFKAGISKTQCMWLVTEATNYFMRRGTAVSACLLDCSKAFDKCGFDKLFEKLLAKGLPQVVIRRANWMCQTGRYDVGPFSNFKWKSAGVSSFTPFYSQYNQMIYSQS